MRMSGPAFRYQHPVASTYGVHEPGRKHTTWYHTMTNGVRHGTAHKHSLRIQHQLVRTSRPTNQFLGLNKKRQFEHWTWQANLIMLDIRSYNLHWHHPSPIFRHDFPLKNSPFPTWHRTQTLTAHPTPAGSNISPDKSVFGTEQEKAVRTLNMTSQILSSSPPRYLKHLAQSQFECRAQQASFKKI